MTALRIDYIEDGGWLVRGTKDLTEEEARNALAQRYITQGDEESSLPWDASDAYAAAARWDVKIGLFRKNPCVCGGDHLFDMNEVKERGPGVFTGAYMT
jgi:hypothetical protein